MFQCYLARPSFIKRNNTCEESKRLRSQSKSGLLQWPEKERFRVSIKTCNRGDKPMFYMEFYRFSARYPILLYCH